MTNCCLTIIFSSLLFGRSPRWALDYPLEPRADRARHFVRCLKFDRRPIGRHHFGAGFRRFARPCSRPFGLARLPATNQRCLEEMAKGQQERSTSVTSVFWKIIGNDRELCAPVGFCFFHENDGT